jgi:hypothetical protein
LTQRGKRDVPLDDAAASMTNSDQQTVKHEASLQTLSAETRLPMPAAFNHL